MLRRGAVIISDREQTPDGPVLVSSECTFALCTRGLKLDGVTDVADEWDIEEKHFEEVQHVVMGEHEEIEKKTPKGTK